MSPTTEQLAAELDELAPHLALGPNQSATLRAAAARLRELSEVIRTMFREYQADEAGDPVIINTCIERLAELAQLTETHSEP